MERTVKVVMSLPKGSQRSTYYITFEERFGHDPELVSVELGGDLLDITDRLSDFDKAHVLRRISKLQSR